jgi:hypothetical protein
MLNSFDIAYTQYQSFSICHVTYSFQIIYTYAYVMFRYVYIRAKLIDMSPIFD